MVKRFKDIQGIIQGMSFGLQEKPACQESDLKVLEAEKLNFFGDSEIYRVLDDECWSYPSSPSAQGSDEEFSI